MRSTKKIPTTLKSRVSEGDQESYEEYWRDGSTTAIRKLLIEELQARINASVSKADKKDKFELNDWSFYQAHEGGYREALRELIRILDL